MGETCRDGNNDAELWFGRKIEGATTRYSGFALKIVCSYGRILVILYVNSMAFTRVILNTNVDEQRRCGELREYRKYKNRTLSDVEKDYLNSIKMLEQKTDKS